MTMKNTVPELSDLAFHPKKQKPTRRFTSLAVGLSSLRIPYFYFAQSFPRQKGLIRVPEPVKGDIDEPILWPL